MRATLRVALWFIVIAIIAGIAAWLADRPGTIAVDWLGYRIEMTVGVLIGAVILVGAVLAALGRLIAMALRGPRLFAELRRRRKRRQGELSLVRGLVAVAAGDAKDAKRQAIAAEGATDGSPLALLLAAQAAQLNGDVAAAERAYNLMLTDSETKFLGLRGLIVLAQRRGDTTTALALAREAQALRPGAPWVASELFGLQAALGEWHAAEETLAGAVRHKLIAAPEGKHNRAVVLIGRADEAAAKGESREALGLLETAHTLEPDFVPATARLARLLAANGKLRRAEKLIEAAWVEAPHPDLAAAYADLVPDEAAEDKARRLERLAAQNSQARDSRLLKAEQALTLRDWAGARTALIAMVDGQEATRRTYDLLADLEHREKGDERRAAEWREKAHTGEAAPRWYCNACNHTPPHWAPHCPACRSFDTLEWRVPGAAAEILPPPTVPADGTLAPASVAKTV